MSRTSSFVWCVLLVLSPLSALAQTTESAPPPAATCCNKGDVANTLAVALGTGLLHFGVGRLEAPTGSTWREPPDVDRTMRGLLLFGEREALAEILSDATYGVSAGGAIIVALSLDNLPGRLPGLQRVIAAWGMTNAVNSLLKREFSRERPGEFYKNPGAEISVDERFVSMPSGHASGSFAVVVAALRVCQREQCSSKATIKKVLIPAAALTAVLRISADKHYFTDIVAGAALGSAIGWYLPTVWKHDGGEAAVTALPSLTPSTIGMSAVITWR